MKHAGDRSFSRNPDASDARDHAIKAVETVLIPIVVPKQEQAAGELGQGNPKEEEVRAAIGRLSDAMGSTA